MLRLLTLLIGASVFALCSQPTVAQGLDVERIEAVADSLASGQIEGGLTPGLTVAVAKAGEILFARGYGQADVEMGVGAGPETVYRIGSLTKQFTAAAILRLAESGMIALDDPITDHLPGFSTHGHQVTVGHLLNHTRGSEAIAMWSPKSGRPLVDDRFWTCPRRR